MKLKFTPRRLKLRSSFWRWGWRSGAVVGGIVVSLLLLAGGSYALFFAGSSQPSGASSVNLQKGLVGHWKFDGNAKDSTPYARDGTVNGATLAPDRAGKANSAYSFDGTSSNITVAKPYNPTSGFTWSVWVYPTSSTEDGGIMGNGVYNYIRVMAGGTVLVELYQANASYTTVTANNALTINSWNLVTMTDDGSAITIYVNGQQAAQNTGIQGIAGTDYVSVFGYCRVDTNNYFLGSLDDARVYNRVINPAEVKALYTTYNPGIQLGSLEKGLIGHWKFDGNLKDSTPYGIDASVVAGSVTPTAGPSGTPDSAYAFPAGYNRLSAGIPPSLTYPGLTLSVWVNPSAYPSALATIIEGLWSSGQAYYLSFGSDGSVQTYWYGRNPTGYFSSGAGTVPLNKWSMVQAVWTASNVMLYVNGQLKGTFSSTGTGSIPDTVIFGAETSARNFVGSMSDIRVYNRALSAAEIQQLYNSYDSQINLGSSGSADANSVNLSKGLIGYWPFNGNAKDATPYGDNGAVNGAALTTDRFGNPNSAYSFNGTNQYINLGTSSVLTPASISWSVWVNANSLGSWNGIVSNMSAWGTGFGLQMGTAQNIAATVSGTYLKTSWVPSTGVWYNIVATHDAATNNNVLYVNGTQQATLASQPISYEASPTTEIGVFYTTPSLYFNGTIDNVRLYNRALNPAEVQALYNLHD